MQEQHRPSDNDLAGRHRQDTQAPPPGGRSSRGPVVSPGGAPDPRVPVPPYEDRLRAATSTNQPRPPEAGDEALSGAGGIRPASPSEHGRRSSLDGAVTPADEQPAENYPGQHSDYQGVGPAHVRGVTRGEEFALGRSDQEGEQDRTAGALGRPMPPRSTGIFDTRPTG